MKTPDEVAAELLGDSYDALDDQTRKVASHIAKRMSIARSTEKDYEATATFGLVSRRNVFDPFPFILLNLFLSMLAAIQAPIMLMSQNRQAHKDRLRATHDYEVNLKAELEIKLLHDKMDHLRQAQWSDLLAMQKEQLQLLQSLVQTPTAN